jgi:hypothetical protein
MAVLDTALSKSLQASSFKAGTLFRLKGTDTLDESKLTVLKVQDRMRVDW